MMTEGVWLVKLILSHLLTDFVFQPTGWVTDRGKRHFASSKLYWHGLLTAAIAYLMIGWKYWGGEFGDIGNAYSYRWLEVVQTREDPLFSDRSAASFPRTNGMLAIYLPGLGVYQRTLAEMECRPAFLGHPDCGHFPYQSVWNSDRATDQPAEQESRRSGEVKTEYLVIGTLMSLATAILVGLVAKRLGFR
jgi:hypothetical protein